MKNRNLFSKSLIVVLFATIWISSCDNGEENVTPEPLSAPELTLASSTVTTLNPGDPIDITLDIEAEGGLQSIVVNKNGGFFDEVTLDTADRTFTFTDGVVPADAEEASSISYEFIGVNTEETESSPLAVEINIDRYETISIGGTELFDMTTDIPSNNLLETGSIKLAAGRSYYLSLPDTGNVEITFAAGTQLTIEQGVTVYMQSGVDLELILEGTVDVQGTATNPVVFTSENVLIEGVEPEAGDWNQLQIEGTGDGSNSGIFQYVRIEYSGDRAFLVDNVGNGSTISHVQVWKCTDEGMFIGNGDVNLSYLVVTDSEDTQYRLEDEYKGNMQFILAVISLQDDGDEAMYLRGDSRATISNVTVVGPGLIDGIGEPDGLRFWSSQGNKVYNTIVAELPSYGVRAEASETDGRPAITDINGPVVFAHSRVFNTEIKDEETGNLGDDDASVFFTDASFNNSTDPVAGIGPVDFVPDAAPSSSFDPSSLGNFFQAAAFIGAVENAGNDWTAGWVKNPDGTIR